MQQMLSAHPEVSIASETHFMRRFWVNRAAYGDLESDTAFHRLISDIIAMPEFDDMGLSSATFKAEAVNGPRDYRALFALLLSMFGARTGAQVYGEKTPNHLLHVGTLREFFPNARFIHMVRDPRAVVLSWTRVPWSTGSIDGNADVWCKYVRAAERYRRDDPGFHTVRYEDLVAAPTPTLRAVGDFLGLESIADMLGFNERSEGLNFDREPWKKGVLDAVGAERGETWKSELSPDSIRRVESIAWRGMRRYGYPLRSNGFQLLPHMVAAAATRSRRRLSKLRIGLRGS
jgi:hypothetical protein